MKSPQYSMMGTSQSFFILVTMATIQDLPIFNIFENIWNFLGVLCCFIQIFFKVHH